ncbi:MAG: heme anaerobic degradation radical SAM methyltransferase ChuW/HutW [Veillonellaceae bacterium]|nr:heme anaerobic degradation radical SAM methyltransferase ChuW/HutW [Veillonellaceae bacterium]
MRDGGAAARLTAALKRLSPEEREWIYGRDTADALHDAFGQKRVVHAGRGGQPLLVPAEQQAVWRERLAEPYGGDGRSVYIHIPFCDRKCLYCGFFQNFTEAELVEEYTDALCEEIRGIAGARRLAGRPVEAVYFGGGTPSVLSGAQLTRILTALRDSVPLANDCEITLEGRLHDFTPEYFATVTEAGINRISLGLQSFDTRVRKSVGRIDAEDVVCERLAHMVRSGRAAIIVDLIFGLPYQTPAVWQRDLELQHELGLHGGDWYQLNIFPHSELYRAIETGKLPAGATTAEQADMFMQALDELERRPVLRRIDVSHWALGTRERSVYNTLTKGSRDVIPFGCGAGGKLSGYGMMNYRTLAEYMAAVARGEKPLQFMTRPEPEYDILGDFMQQLEGMYLDGEAFLRRWGHNPLELFAPVFEVWQQKGLVTVDGHILRLTRAGQFWHDNVIQAVVELWRMARTEQPIRPAVEDVARQDELVQRLTPDERAAGVALRLREMSGMLAGAAIPNHPHALRLQKILTKLGLERLPEEEAQLLEVAKEWLAADERRRG